MVCIDDFAIRKRESYGTIMVDIETHRVIDLIPSRECNDVAAWLKTYPNLKIISRDGSITYHNAITTAHPNVVQVSDRFHIIKNLASYCKEFLMKLFTVKITIDLPQETQSDVIETPDISVKDRKDNLHVKSSLELSHEEKLSQKQELIETVRSMHEKKCSIRSISKELQLSRPTVTRYLDEGVTAIHGSYSVKRKSILDPYISDINVFLDKGSTSPVIEAKIRQKGYTGSSSTLRTYMARLRKLIPTTYTAHKITPENTELVSRKLLIKLLFKPLKKIKGLDKECLDRVNSQYPRYKEIIDIVNEFKKLLLVRVRQS